MTETEIEIEAEARIVTVIAPEIATGIVVTPLLRPTVERGDE